MLTVTNKAIIQWKLNPSFFKKANESNIVEPKRYLGSSKRAVDAMLAKGELLRDLMPPIIGLDPNSPNSNWTTRIKHYWDSLNIIVQPKGYDLDLSFDYSVDSTKPKVVELVKNNKSIKTDQDLVDFVLGTTNGITNVREDDKFRYGTPVKPEDYLLWIYTFEYRDVANKMEDADKSKEIRFYIEFEGDVAKLRKETFLKTAEANEMFILAVKDKVKVDNMLYLFDADPSDTSVYADYTDKQMFLQQKSIEQPDEFVKIYNDKSLDTKATIERLIRKGILNRLPNTEIIVDAADPEFIVGNSKHEAVLFFKSDAATKVAKVKEFKTRLSSLT